jgi:hypothetical protein
MAEMIEEALERYAIQRDSKLAQDALAFQLNYTFRTDLDKVRLAAFSCRLLLDLYFCQKEADGDKKKAHRKFIVKELEALIKLVEKLLII